jgi:hypothetical protein
MTDEATGRLLGGFVGAVQPVLPLVSVWAHGSLAGGDYQPGRSDLDLIAILGRPCTAAEERQLGQVHESLGRAIASLDGVRLARMLAGASGALLDRLGTVVGHVALLEDHARAVDSERRVAP